MSAAWVKVGAKCVLVNGAGCLQFDAGDWKIGDICEVLEVTYQYGRAYLRVQEVEGRWRHGDLCFAHVWRFRPLVANKTQAEDIALFTHHLEMGEELVLGGSSYRSLGRV